MSREDGGPAYPQLYISSPEPGDYRTMVEGGMTLRDYFAAKAMQALLQSFPYSGAKDAANSAYAQADAMLAARKENTR